MPTSNQPATTSQLTIERVFDAPVELVWAAWTEPGRLARWWGPRGFTAPTIKNDFRVGGKYVYCMRAPDGQEYWSTGVYREIVHHQRIVTTDSFADSDGNVVHPSHHGIKENLAMEIQMTVTFEPLGNRTKLTIHNIGEGEIHPGADTGWNETLDKLAELLS